MTKRAWCIGLDTENRKKNAPGSCRGAVADRRSGRKHENPITVRTPEVTTAAAGINRFKAC